MIHCDKMKKEAMFYTQKEDKKVECNLCAHKCIIKDSKFGLCNVRQNIDGRLYSQVYGELIANSVDPIEKKPLYHFLPGSNSYSIATSGCNFRCSFCQNWQISQVKKNRLETFRKRYTKPETVVQKAVDNNCKSISYTYTEPTIFFEYAYDTAKLAKKNDLKNVFVTNGYMSNEALKKISPYLDAANIDLKSFRDEFYKKMCKARLKPVLNTIKKMIEHGIWVEITTLVVPRQNDSDEELNNIAEFISNVSKDIPWHISRFHPDYRYNSSEPTPIETMEKAYTFGKNHGLKYIYLGNVSNEKSTICTNCGKKILKRSFFGIKKIDIKDGKCKHCNSKIEGIWK